MIGYKKLEDIIRPILEILPKTRDDDSLLYIEYCRKVNASVLGMRFEDVLEFRNRLGIKSIESVGRCRRKLQEKCPELRGSYNATEDRYAKFKESMDYASE